MQLRHTTVICTGHTGIFSYLELFVCLLTMLYINQAVTARTFSLVGVKQIVKM